MERAKFIEIDGVRFCRDEKRGYYLNGTTRQYAHRFSYERYIGPIPEGFHVHHIDHDRGNNDPSNLIALSPDDHAALHGWVNGKAPEYIAKAIQRMNHARKSASAWHTSEEGRAWHREHAKTTIMTRKPKPKTCDQCEAQFETIHGGTRFCSNACKSRWRRAAGLDDVVKKCLQCDKDFSSNKYSKTKTCGLSCANLLRDSVGTMRARQKVLCK